MDFLLELDSEKLAKITFNLPTHINISEKQAEKIMGTFHLLDLTKVN